MSGLASGAPAGACSSTRRSIQRAAAHRELPVPALQKPRTVDSRPECAYDANLAGPLQAASLAWQCAKRSSTGAGRDGEPLPRMLCVSWMLSSSSARMSGWSRTGISAGHVLSHGRALSSTRTARAPSASATLSLTSCAWVVLSRWGSSPAVRGGPSRCGSPRHRPRRRRQSPVVCRGGGWRPSCGPRSRSRGACGHRGPLPRRGAKSRVASLASKSRVLWCGRRLSARTPRTRACG